MRHFITLSISVVVIIASTFITGPGRAESEDNQACPQEFISDAAPDNAVAVSFLSSVDFWGNSLDDLIPGTTLRMGEPFQISVRFDKPLDCTGANVALYDNREGPILRRIPVRAADDSRTVFLSEPLTLVWKDIEGENDIVMTPSERKPALIVRTRMTTGPHEFRRYAGHTRLVLPPFKKDRGDLAVQILNHRGQPLRGTVARQGTVTATKRDKSVDVPYQFGHHFMIREIETGTYTVRMDILGSVMTQDKVTVTEHRRTEVTFGGPKEFGQLEMTDATYDFLEKALGGLPVLDCTYTKDGKPVLTASGCFVDPLPKGTYTLSVGAAWMPFVKQITVRAGNSLPFEPEFGVLVIRESRRNRDSGRELTAQARRQDTQSKPVSFTRETRLLLEAGTYAVTVEVTGSDKVYRIPVTIAARQTTFFPIDKRTNETSLYFDPTGEGLLPGPLDEYGGIMEE